MVSLKQMMLLWSHIKKHLTEKFLNAQNVI